ncbi:MAG: NlpC/P60 family protein [Asticcacaulis sp.]
MSAFDRRLTLAREDLAELSLEGLLKAGRYQKAQLHQCCVPVTAIRSRPDAAAEQTDQLLYGELFSVLTVENGFAWGQANRDGYVGFVALEALREQIVLPTHRLKTLASYAYAEPSVRAPVLARLGHNALVRVEAEQGRYSQLAGLGWVPSDHLADLLSFESDWVAAAERYLGVPYLWGGRDALGIDCSGLVQQALTASGRFCPRDTDMQAAQLGHALEIGADLSGLMRGDLVFWKGHVGIMADAETLLHANGHHMAVVRESLAGAVARIRAHEYSEPTAFRRL